MNRDHTHDCCRECYALERELVREMEARIAEALHDQINEIVQAALDGGYMIAVNPPDPNPRWTL